MADYRRTLKVRDIAEGVIEEHHELLSKRGPRMEWVLTRPSTPSARVPDFKIRKVTGVNAFLAAGMSDSFVFQSDPFIAVEVSESFWAMLEKRGGEQGFVDHVLSHLVYDFEKETWSIEGPQFGEFKPVLQRHGFWRPGKEYKQFAEVVSEQLSLLPEDDEDADEAPENLEVSITHDGQTVHTDTYIMRKSGERSVIHHGPNGEAVDAETGEVLEGARL